eukprot:3230373-Rhodomonas_salina.2
MPRTANTRNAIFTPFGSGMLVSISDFGGYTRRALALPRLCVSARRGERGGESACCERTRGRGRGRKSSGQTHTDRSSSA